MEGFRSESYAIWFMGHRRVHSVMYNDFLYRQPFIASLMPAAGREAGECQTGHIRGFVTGNRGLAAANTSLH